MNYDEASKTTLAQRLLDHLFKLDLISERAYYDLLYPSWEDIYDADESLRLDNEEYSR